MHNVLALFDHLVDYILDEFECVNSYESEPRVCVYMTWGDQSLFVVDDLLLAIKRINGTKTYVFVPFFKILPLKRPFEVL